MYRFVGLAAVCACGKRVGDDEKTRRTSRRRLWPRVDEKKKKQKIIINAVSCLGARAGRPTLRRRRRGFRSRRQIYFPVANYERIARINVAYYTRCGNRRVNDTHRIKKHSEVSISIYRSRIQMSPCFPPPDRTENIH